MPVEPQRKKVSKSIYSMFQKQAVSQKQSNNIVLLNESNCHRLQFLLLVERPLLQWLHLCICSRVKEL